MSKKLALVLAVIFLSSFNLVQAEVVINEFMSDPSSGPEWIELLNNSSSEINLDGWKWTELASPGTDTEHEISPKNLSGTIGAGGFFVFELSSALNNSGDSIGLYNGTDLMDRVTFGNVNNYSKDLEVSAKGKTGALISGAWKSNQEPTRGQVNPFSVSSDEEASAASDDEEGGSESDKKIPQKLQKPKIQIISTKLAHVGVPFAIQGTGTGTLGEKLSHGRYYWNFSDGDFREVKVTNNEKFTHTYFYPGDYTIIFEYYPDVFTDVPDAVAEATIKVLEPKILISRVGEANDFFIEITNETGHEADLSNWVLLSDYKVFTLPKNTTLSANKKMVISPKVSGFSVGDKSSLKLMTPQRELVFSYAYPVAPAKVATKKSSYIVKNEEKTLFAPKDLTAASILGQDKKTSGSTLSFVPVIFLVFVGISAGGVYFIRRHRNTSKISSDDFDILDE